MRCATQLQATEVTAAAAKKQKQAPGARADPAAHEEEDLGEDEDDEDGETEEGSEEESEEETSEEDSSDEVTAPLTPAFASRNEAVTAAPPPANAEGPSGMLH